MLTSSSFTLLYILKIIWSPLFGHTHVNVQILIDHSSVSHYATPWISDAERDLHDGTSDVQRLCAEEACVLRNQSGRVHACSVTSVHQAVLQPSTPAVAGRPVGVPVLGLGNINNAQTVQATWSKSLAQTQELGEYYSCIIYFFTSVHLYVQYLHE